MNHKLQQFLSEIKGKRVAVIGAGISNRPLIRWLWSFHPDITVFDQMQENDPRLLAIRQDMETDGCRPEWRVGQGYLDHLHGFDLIFRTPKMRLDTPALLRERERGAVITSEIALLLELCPAPVYAVTGSDGKTTTTTLISLMLQNAGYCVFTGGNIGTPLLDRIGEMKKEDRVVLELSSFQLMDMTPNVRCAVITNIIPNHLDFHRDFKEYIDAKKNIFRGQHPGDRLILNANDPVSSVFDREAKGEVRFFNRRPDHEHPAGWEEDGTLLIGRASETPSRIIRNDAVLLPGAFNRWNILAAALAVSDDVPVKAMSEVAGSFTGVHHRLELVRDLDGVRWYNSSVDSSPARTMHTLEAVREQNLPCVLITGGQDKNSDYTGLGKAILKTTQRIVLCGQNSALILDAMKCESGGDVPAFGELTVVQTDHYDEAVAAAQSLAVPGDAVVLSPAGTSYDQFRHFEERGNRFRDLVLAL